jgi:hypothetical protein
MLESRSGPIGVCFTGVQANRGEFFMLESRSAANMGEFYRGAGQ